MMLVPMVALADDPTSDSTTSGPASKKPSPPPPPMGVWTGKGQAGFLDSHGNSDAKSANAALDMSYLQDAWKHAFHFDLLYGQSAGITSAERYDGLWQSSYNFTSNLYTFGALRYEHDLFDGFQYQASGTAGVGYKLFDSDTIKLSTQLGAGYMASRPETLVYDASGTVVTARNLLPYQGYAIATVGLNYSQKLTRTTTLSDTLLIDAGSVNTLITNTLALAITMSKKLALSLGYNVQDNTQPPVGTRALDTIETVNLVYSF
jgi:putative salt-induced outer membrane protein